MTLLFLTLLDSYNPYLWNAFWSILGMLNERWSMSISDCILLLQYFNHLQLIIVHVVTSYVSFKILNIILFFTQFVALIKRFFTWKCACFLYFKFLFPRKWQQCFPNILTQTLKVVFVVSFILFPSIWTTGFLNLFVLPIFFYTCFLISQMVFIFYFYFLNLLIYFSFI